MKKPSVQRVEIPTHEIPRAVDGLITYWVLPDGTDVVDRRSLNRYRKQLQQGYFDRLIWPGMTKGEIIEWLDNANEIVKWHKAGLL